jgi:hypothetical protein
MSTSTKPKLAPMKINGISSLSNTSGILTPSRGAAALVSAAH